MRRLPFRSRDSHEAHASELSAAGIRRINGMIAVTALALVLPYQAMAQNAVSDWLSFYEDQSSGNYLKGDLSFNSAHFAQSNSWAGNDEELLGDESDFWGEYGVSVGLEGAYNLQNGSRFSSRISGVYTTTRHGLDAGGSNLNEAGDSDDNADATTIEEAYLRWSSGSLWPSLGEDAVEITGGSQVYKQGHGFLFYDAGSDGGDRGGFWLGMRKAYQMAFTARLKTGPWMAEAYYLEPDDRGDDTEMAGANIEYSFGDRAEIGFSYTNVLDSNTARRDGLDIFDFRGSAQPFADYPQFRVEGELAIEDNGDLNDSMGYYFKAYYDFEDRFRWQPKIYYRYAHFSGDDGLGDNEAFDPINYGFDDWNQWFIGEIIGEYVSSNRNLGTHTLNLNLTFSEDISGGFYWIYYKADELESVIVPRPPTSPRAALITDKDLAQEINFTLDWNVTDAFYVGMMAGWVFPDDGGEDFFGDDDTWGVFMLNLGYSL